MPLDVPFELNSDTVQHIEGRMVINETGPLMASLDDVFSIFYLVVMAFLHLK